MVKIKTRTKINKATNKVGTNGPADGEAGEATGTKTRVGATGVTGAIGAIQTRVVTSSKVKDRAKGRVAVKAKGRIHKTSSSSNNGRLIILLNSGTNGNNGNNSSSNNGQGINKAIRQATRNRILLRHGHNITRTMPVTRITLAIIQCPAVTRNDLHRSNNTGDLTIKTCYIHIIRSINYKDNTFRIIHLDIFSMYHKCLINKDWLSTYSFSGYITQVTL